MHMEPDVLPTEGNSRKAAPSVMNRRRALRLFCYGKMDAPGAGRDTEGWKKAAAHGASWRGREACMVSRPTME